MWDEIREYIYIHWLSVEDRSPPADRWFIFCLYSNHIVHKDGKRYDKRHSLLVVSVCVRLSECGYVCVHFAAAWSGRLLLNQYSAPRLPSRIGSMRYFILWALPYPLNNICTAKDVSTTSLWNKEQKKNARNMALIWLWNSRGQSRNVLILLMKFNL